MPITSGFDSPSTPKNIQDAPPALTCNTIEDLCAIIPDTVFIIKGGHAPELYSAGIIDDAHVYDVDRERWGGIDMATIFDQQWLTVPKSADTFFYWMENELRQQTWSGHLEVIQLYIQRGQPPDAEKIQQMIARAKSNFAFFASQSALVDRHLLSDQRFTTHNLDTLKNADGRLWAEVIEKHIAKNLGPKDESGRRTPIDIEQKIENAIQRGISSRL